MERQLMDITLIENIQEERLMAAWEKLNTLRRLSNTIQALENVIGQCGDDQSLLSLRTCVADQLDQLHKVLRRQIHS